MNLYRESRLGPMSGRLSILFKTQPDLADSIYDFVIEEITQGYRTRPRNVHTTYLYIDTVYLGCVRTSKTIEGGYEVRVKPYNATHDDTRRISNLFAEQSGQNSETAATYACTQEPLASSKERLRFFCNEWSKQVSEPPLDLEAYPYIKGNIEEILEEAEFTKPAQGGVPNSFKFHAETMFNFTDGLYVVQMDRYGGGELLKRHSQWQNGVSVDFYQRVFTWIGSPTGEIDKKYTVKIMEDIVNGTWSRQPYVITFPTPLAEERLSDD